jgi:hypothetical protein
VRSLGPWCFWWASRLSTTAAQASANFGQEEERASGRQYWCGAGMVPIVPAYRRNGRSMCVHPAPGAHRAVRSIGHEQLSSCHTVVVGLLRGDDSSPVKTEPEGGEVHR